MVSLEPFFLRLMLPRYWMSGMVFAESIPNPTAVPQLASWARAVPLRRLHAPSARGSAGVERPRPKSPRSCNTGG
jgi:hypothetical protein